MSSLQISSHNVSTTTLTQLVEGLGETSSKHDGKSLRLHQKTFGDTTIKVHTSWSRPGHGTQRQEKRQDALNLVKQAMIHEYEIDEKAAGKILEKICVKPGRISLGQLKTLGKVMELKQNRDPRMEKIEEFKKLNLDDLAKLNNKWSPTSQGGTGAMIVRDKSLPYGGVIVKCESPQNFNAASGTSAYILEISDKLADEGLQLPFDAMVIEEATFGENTLTKIGEELNLNRTEENGRRVDLGIEKLDFVDKKEMIPMKAMFLKGAQDISSLPVEDRVRLFKGNDFPRSLGGVMMMSKLLGLADHVGMGLQGHIGGSYTNLTNLMINPSTNRVALIDYAWAFGGRGDDKNGVPVSGFTPQHIKTAFEKLKDIAEKSSSLPLNTGHNLSNREDVDMGPFFDMMNKAMDDGTLFIKDDKKNIDETEQLKSITPLEKNKFVINTLIGALDALKLIADNPKAFTSGTPMFEDSENVIKHLVKLAKGIDKIRDKLVEYVDQN